MAELSISDQIKLSTLDLNSQLLQGTFSAISKVSGQKTTQTNSLTSALTSNNFSVYAVEGDSKYKEEIDSDDDGIITFNEYVKYVSEQSFNDKTNNALKNLARYTKTEDSETGTEKVTIQNLGKAIRSYLNSSITLPQGKINAEG